MARGGILYPMSPNVTGFRIAEKKGPCKLRCHNTNTLIYHQDRESSRTRALDCGQKDSNSIEATQTRTTPDGTFSIGASKTGPPHVGVTASWPATASFLFTFRAASPSRSWMARVSSSWRFNCM